ncbi:MAG: branched-chain amino acid ABC transporter permease [Ilumatobacteraceae bacterium]
MNWVNALISGVLVGGLYALYATGLSLTFGVMRIINLAHGDMAVVAAFVCSTLVLSLAWNPVAVLVLVVPLGFAGGWALQRVAFDRLVGVDPAYQIVATFGLAIAIQNLLLRVYSPDPRGLDAGSLVTASIRISDDVAIGWFPLLRFVVAVLVLAALSLFLARTRLGQGFRATSDDPATARLMGIDSKVIYGVAMGLSGATIALAGVFNGAQTQFAAADGPLLLIYAFEAVVIGGLGSLWGTLAGGVILGVAQSIGAEIDPGWKQLAGHLVFLAFLVVRPTGLFGTGSA